jgi:hypothetical protein
MQVINLLLAFFGLYFQALMNAQSNLFTLQGFTGYLVQTCSVITW